jgi:NAD(P)H-flavin reductase
MKEGERVDLLNVVGHGFDLDQQKGRDLVFVAMGTGVAPLRSALRHVLQRKADFGELVVLYGARTPDDFCYRDETQSWEDAGVELRQVISRPDGHDWSGSTGYVQTLLDHVLPDLNAPVALVCGSREMIEQTRDRLQQMGFASEAILTNYWVVRTACGSGRASTPPHDLNCKDGTRSPSLRVLPARRSGLLLQITYVLNQRINFCFGKLLAESGHLFFAV